MAVATVREIKKAMPDKGLSQMIDQAGELNAEKNAYEQAYNVLRGKISIAMPMGDSDVVEKQGEEYEAKHFYPAEKRIDPQKLFKFDKELFWRLIRVSLGDAEKSLPADVFHELLEVNLADAPRLTITKIRKRG